ncbi:MAG: 30S ribosome-binding factor RbfA [Candidatus Omnitrophota bacterium]
MKRVQEAIKREISVILQEEINDPRVKGITVTGVEMTRDLKLAKVFYILSSSSSAEEKKDAEKGLKSAAGFIRRELGRRVPMKFVPQISFREDTLDEKKRTLNNVFEEIEKEHREKA